MDDHTASPIVFVAVWAGLIFGLGVGIGAFLGWLANKYLKAQVFSGSP